MMDQTIARVPSEAPFAEGVDCLAQGPNSALISTRVCPGADQPLGLSWEVFAEGEREPVRYGLCLARPQENFRVRVPVLGLESGRSYRFQFRLDAQVSEQGRFHTIGVRDELRAHPGPLAA